MFCTFPHGVSVAAATISFTLAGQFAARNELIDSISFFVGTVSFGAYFTGVRTQVFYHIGVPVILTFPDEFSFARSCSKMI